jgi:hypothetical protein
MAEAIVLDAATPTKREFREGAIKLDRPSQQSLEGNDEPKV